MWPDYHYILTLFYIFICSKKKLQEPRFIWDITQLFLDSIKTIVFSRYVSDGSP